MNSQDIIAVVKFDDTNEYRIHETKIVFVTGKVAIKAPEFTIGEFKELVKLVDDDQDVVECFIGKYRGIIRDVVVGRVVWVEWNEYDYCHLDPKHVQIIGSMSIVGDS